MPLLIRSSSAIERRRLYLISMEQALPKEAREILLGLIVECLDDDPLKRPTAKKLFDVLGMLIIT